MKTTRVLAVVILFSMAPEARADEVLQVTNLGLNARPIELVHTREHGDWVRTSKSEGMLEADVNRDGDKLDFIHRLDNILTGETRSLIGPAVAEVHFFREGWLISVFHESRIGDLNGDGDRTDTLLDTYDMGTMDTRRIELLAYPTHNFLDVIPLGDRWLAFETAEEGKDLDGDGDPHDMVITMYHLASGEARVIGLAAVEAIGSGDLLFLKVSEELQGVDLNGDGQVDPRTYVLYGHDIAMNETKNLGLTYTSVDAEASAFIGFHGDQLVTVARRSSGESEIHIHGFASGKSTSTGLYARQGLIPIASALLPRGLIICELEEERSGAQRDLNGDGDTKDSVIHIYDLVSGESTNLEITFGEATTPREVATAVSLSGDWLLVRVPETEQGADLNSDGDMIDSVVHVHNLVTKETRNTRIAATWAQGARNPQAVYGERVVLIAYEVTEVNGQGRREDLLLHSYDLVLGQTATTTVQGVNDSSDIAIYHDWVLLGRVEGWLVSDLNGDGDMTDEVLHVYNIDTQETVNLGVSTLSVRSRERMHGRCVVFSVEESTEGRDMNGNGDPRETVTLVHGVMTGVTAIIGYDGYYFGELRDGSGVLVVFQSEGERGDLNGDADEVDDIAHLVRLAPYAPVTRFLRGDSNDDAAINIADAVYVLNWLFLGGEVPECIAAANSNGDGQVDIADPVYLLNHLFFGGVAPVPPYPECGAGSLPMDVGACHASQQCMR